MIADFLPRSLPAVVVAGYGKCFEFLVLSVELREKAKKRGARPTPKAEPLDVPLQGHLEDN